MTFFSQRNEYNNINKIQLEETSETIKNRIYATFFKEEFDITDGYAFGINTTGIEDMMIEMGIVYKYPDNRIVKNQNAELLKKEIIDNGKWYTIYDFIEKYLMKCDDEKLFRIRTEFNRILEEEVSAYRISGKIVVPITNKYELETVEEAQNNEYEAVRIHLSKALELFANRTKPDYENSIKESISAVEAICCIITGMTGKNATLGNTLKKLKDNGVHIHSAMEKAFLSLYGYTSDEDGIRHGGMDFANAPSEDARYMLISCSAFINYLMDKWSKIK